MPMETSHSLNVPGAYNPAAALPAKVVKRILDLDFVEMSEISIDAEPPSNSSRTPTQTRLPITDISVWVERFSLMAAILVTRFPDKAAELLAYQASIVRAERNYEGKRWVLYDRQYRRQALARKNLDWSVPDSRLYNKAFTGRAKAIARCNHCLQDDHTTNLCPLNPNPPAQSWVPDGTPWPVAYPPHRNHQTSRSSICRRWNDGRCKFSWCKYRHECLGCGGAHMALDCPQKRPSVRNRSPLQGSTRLPTQQPPLSGPRGNRL